MLPLLDDNILLIKPAPGLMIWTLVTFLIVLYILKRVAFGRIAEMLEARRTRGPGQPEAAEAARDEAQQLLDEYRQQLAAARHEASQIVERAQRTGEEERRRMHDELQAERERGVAAAKSAIEAETRQSLDRIKSEIADLTLQATEAVLPHQARRRRVQAPDRRGAVRCRLLQADERLTMADAAALPFAEAPVRGCAQGRPPRCGQPRSRRRAHGDRRRTRPGAIPPQPGLPGRREAAGPRAR